MVVLKLDVCIVLAMWDILKCILSWIMYNFRWEMMRRLHMLFLPYEIAMKNLQM
jgi:hypothetical protein